MNLSYQLQKRLSKSKVQHQLFSVYSLGIFLPLLIISFILILNTKKLLIQHYSTQLQSNNLRVKSILFDVTTNFYNISEEITYDKNLLSILQTDFQSVEEARITLNNYSSLQNFTNNNTSISSLSIYTYNSSISDLYYFKPVTPSVLESSWFKKAATQATPFWQSICVKDSWGNLSWELSLIRRIPLLETKGYAILIIGISNNYLKNRIQNNDLFTILSVNQDPIFFCTDRSLCGETLPYNQNNELTCISTLNTYRADDNIYIRSIDFSAIASVKNFILNCSFIIVITMLFPFVLITLFIKYFSSRVQTLRQSMHKVSSGDYDVIDTFNGDDELSQTFSDLKIMIDTIKEKDAKMYKAQIKEQKLANEQHKIEFKMLASQINPHFLYNTLETIRMMAFTSGNKEVANAIKLLGKSMHYVLENTGTSSTSLKNELDYITTYLSIQKLRFSDRVNYSLMIDDNLDLSNYQILPLLLQPIVENSILHGLENVDSNGNITITIKIKNNNLLLIDISDNGIGMSKNELEQLNYNIKYYDKSRTSSIGLYNINQRIKLCYGSYYGIKIESCVSKGTTVSLTLPLYNNWED